MPSRIYRSWAGAGLSKYTSGKMTQAAAALSGSAVLERTHSKLGSIFLPRRVLAGRREQRAGQEMATREESGSPCFLDTQEAAGWTITTPIISLFRGLQRSHCIYAPSANIDDITRDQNKIIITFPRSAAANRSYFVAGRTHLEATLFKTSETAYFHQKNVDAWPTSDILSGILAPASVFTPPLLPFQRLNSRLYNLL